MVGAVHALARHAAERSERRSFFVGAGAGGIAGGADDVFTAGRYVTYKLLAISDRVNYKARAYRCASFMLLARHTARSSGVLLFSQAGVDSISE